MIARFAAEGPHVSIAPEHLFEVGGITITNSMFYGWICAALLILLFIWGRKRVSLNGTKGFSQIFDIGTDFIISTMTTSLGSRARAIKYAPIFVTLFFFILFNNWMGLLPGVGTAFVYGDNPLFRPFTADLNATLGMALVGMFLVHYLAIKENGPTKHIRHYFAGKLTNPVTYVVGIFEIFGELTRLFSLGLRLFLTIAVGEMLIAIFAYLGGPVAPLTALPFTLLEIFIAALQAYIFVLLCVSYLSVAIASGGHEDNKESVQTM